MNDDDKTVVLGAAAPQPPAPAPAAGGSAQSNTLALGTRLGEFELIGLIGEGGFGIVYLALDHSLGRKVALKEYMPSSLASRAADASVTVRSERHRETFETGRRSFVNEARLLAQFDHPALVKVYRFWEANGTAYMAMPFYEGRTLRDELRARGVPPDEAWIKKILVPVIDALDLIHRDHCYHRDIAPDNIMLLRDDRPVLLDFGAARRVISDMTQALTVILKPGYAPIEQYAEMPGMKQGGWTDVYALSAVVYFMITGKTPPPSVGRMIEDAYVPLAQLAAGRYTPSFLAGVDKGLSVRPEGRPQTMADLRDLLGLAGSTVSHSGHGSPQVQSPAETPAPTPTPAAVRSTPTAPARPAPPDAPKKSVAPIIAIVALVLAGGGAAAFLAWKMLPLLHNGGHNDPIAQFGKQSSPIQETASGIPQTPTASTPVTPTVNLPQAPRAANLTEAVQVIAGAADPAIAVSLEAPSSVEVGTGALKLSVRSASSGHLYLFVWDKTEDKFYRIFPNELDANDTLNAGETFTVPRANLAVPWNFAAQAPTGDWQVLALVSAQPRDFANGALRKDDAMQSARRSEIDARLAAGERISTLIGTPICASGQACSDRYGVGTATIAKIDAAPIQTPVVEASKPPAHRTKDPTVAVTPNRRQRPSREDGEAGTGKPANGQDKAEKEYMKKLNRELDQLLKQ